MSEQPTATASGSPSATSSTGRHQFRLDIQGLRAVAVLVVVLFHARLGFSGGFVGVDIFFVISGYVITGMLQAEQGRTGRISLGGFYQRRIRRLLPALCLLLVSVLVLDPFLGPRNGGATSALAAAGALFAGNARLVLTSQGYFDASTEANPFLHLWTLSVEEQVYLAVPLLLVAAWKIAGRRWSWDQTSTAVVGAGAAASFTLAVLLAGRHVVGLGDVGVRFAFYSSPTRAWEFLAGSLLVLVRPVLSPRSRNCAGASGLVILAVTVVTFDGDTLFPAVAALVPVVGTVLLLLAGTGDGSKTSKVLSAGPAQWLGDRSYSWYLWHWPIIVFARSTFPNAAWAPTAAAVFSLVPACISYSLVEQPIRRARTMRTVTTVCIALACTAVPLALTRASAPVARRLDTLRSVRRLQFDMRSHLDLTRRCNDSLPDPATAAACTWPVASARGSAVLLGDSNAGQFSEPFIAAANSRDLTATIQTRAACPFADLVIRRSGVVDDRCRSFYQRQLAAVLRQRPTLVVIASAGDLLIAKPEIELAQHPGGPFSGDQRGELKVWELGLERTLAQLDRAGVGVVVVHPIPRFTGWQSPGACARLRVMADARSCGTTRDRRSPGPVAQAEVRAERAYDNTVGLELERDLCPDARCATFQHDRWVWKDESHLSVDGAVSVRPQLGRAMAEATAAVADRRRPGA